jgi:hypothetical protein
MKIAYFRGNNVIKIGGSDVIALCFPGNMPTSIFRVIKWSRVTIV